MSTPRIKKQPSSFKKANLEHAKGSIVPYSPTTWAFEEKKRGVGRVEDKKTREEERERKVKGCSGA